MNRALVKSFVGLLRALPKEERMEIIREASVDAEPRDPDAWKKLEGAWQGDETAEEIIETIRSSRVEKPDQDLF